MGYYMRFFDTSEPAVNLNGVDTALRKIDQAYRVEVHPETDAMQGELHYGEALYGEIEINQAGDGLFDEEVEEQLETLEEATEGDPVPVADTLRAAKRSVVVRVLWQGRDAEETLERIDPLWAWLFETRAGLLQADSEGFYDSDGLILAVR